MLKQWPEQARRKGLVPTGPIMALVDEWMLGIDDSFAMETGLDGPGCHGKQSDGKFVQLIRRCWPEQHMGLSAEEVGRGGRARLLFRWRETAEHMSFDNADRIVTKLGFGWDYTPELAEIYEQVELKHLDIKHPTCIKVLRQNRNNIRRLYRQMGHYQTVAKALGTTDSQVRATVAA